MKIDNYLLLRDRTYGYVQNNTYKIFGEYKELPLLKNLDSEIVLKDYAHWMRKEIQDQIKLNVLVISK